MAEYLRLLSNVACRVSLWCSLSMHVSGTGSTGGGTRRYAVRWQWWGSTQCWSSLFDIFCTVWALWRCYLSLWRQHRSVSCRFTSWDILRRALRLPGIVRNNDSCICLCVQPFATSLYVCIHVVTVSVCWVRTWSPAPVRTAYWLCQWHAHVSERALCHRGYAPVCGILVCRWRTAWLKYSVYTKPAYWSAWEYLISLELAASVSICLQIERGFACMVMLTI